MFTQTKVQSQATKNNKKEWHPSSLRVSHVVQCFFFILFLQASINVYSNKSPTSLESTKSTKKNDIPHHFVSPTLYNHAFCFYIHAQHLLLVYFIPNSNLDEVNQSMFTNPNIRLKLRNWLWLTSPCKEQGYIPLLSLNSNFLILCNICCHFTIKLNICCQFNICCPFEMAWTTAVLWDIKQSNPIPGVWKEGFIPLLT